MGHEKEQPIWIAGCGDIGRRLARRYAADGIPVSGFVRSDASRQACRCDGVNAIISDFSAGTLDFDPRLLADARVYYFAPPPPGGVGDTALAAFLDHVGDHPARILLISATGVYGDCQGQWIDESWPVNPVADRARRRLDAERRLAAWAARWKKSHVILRVSGIYAPPDRLPLARLRQGAPVLRVSESPYTNRIHADDLAMVCRAAMERAGDGEIFNACDGHPSTMTEYFDRVADYAGLPRPPRVSLAEARKVMSRGMLSYLAESRRIRNDRLLRRLGVALRYPTLESALKNAPGFGTNGVRSQTGKHP